MFWVYAIVNEAGKIYIGQTADLEERLKRHNNILVNKKNAYTARNGKKWKIVYTETLSTRKEARVRERQLKSAKGREFVKRFIRP